MKNSLTAKAFLALICCLSMMFSQSSLATFAPGDAVTVTGNMTSSTISNGTNQSTIDNSSSSNSTLRSDLMNATGINNSNATR
jgi:hypothetical protein